MKRNTGFWVIAFVLAFGTADALAQQRLDAATKILIPSSARTATFKSFLAVVNLDPHHTQRGWVSLPLEPWGIGPRDNLQFHDLLTDARFLWSGRRIYVELDPQFVPAHLLVLRRYVRTERDFDYFL